MAARTRAAAHNGRPTDSSPKLSRLSLDFIDNLLNGVTSPHGPRT